MGSLEDNDGLSSTLHDVKKEEQVVYYRNPSAIPQWVKAAQRLPSSSVRLTDFVQQYVDNGSWEAHSWDLDSLKQFMFYCCPQCDYVQKNVRVFQNHYLKHFASNLKEANDVLEEEFLKVKTDPVVVKEEINSYEPINHDDACQELSTAVNDEDINIPESTANIDLKDDHVTDDENDHVTSTFVLPANVTNVSINSMLKEDPYSGMNLEMDQSKKGGKRGPKKCETPIRNLDLVQCYRCGQIITGPPGSVEKHRLEIHSHAKWIRSGTPRTIQCVHCGRTFPGLPEFNKHCYKTGAHNCINYKCSNCGNTYRYRRTFDWHMKKKKNTGLCPADTKAVNRVEYNVKKKKPKGPVQCKQCPMQFKNYANYKRHEQALHSDEKPHQCHRCGKKFIATYPLNLHIEKYHGEDVSEKYQCDKCGEYFGKRSLVQHISKVHKEKPKGDPVTCSTCGKVYMSRTALSLHNRSCIPTGRPNAVFDCDYCPRSFTSLYVKQQHVKFHMNEFKSTSKQRPRSRCEYCGIVFHVREHLERHLAYLCPKYPNQTMINHDQPYQSSSTSWYQQ